MQHRPASEAYEQLHHGGWDPSDNPQLLVYMKEQLAELARRLTEMGVIDRVPDPLAVIGA